MSENTNGDGGRRGRRRAGTAAAVPPGDPPLPTELVAFALLFVLLGWPALMLIDYALEVFLTYLF